jgi:hypothetical protein
MTSDSTERATQLLAMTQRLVALVGAEIEVVKARKLSSLSADWDEKERLVHAWRIEVSRVKNEPALLDGISPDLKASLRQAAMEMEQNLEAHAQALMATKTVTEDCLVAQRPCRLWPHGRGECCSPARSLRHCGGRKGVILRLFRKRGESLA